MKDNYTPDKLARYGKLNGRLCIMPPREISPVFLPRFLSMSKWENEEVYLSIGSALEAAYFSRIHRDGLSGPRVSINMDFDNVEARRQFVYLIHHSDAAGHFQQTGDRGIANGGVVPGCERLGTGKDAMPVFAIFEVNWNYYYGAEHATITK